MHVCYKYCNKNNSEMILKKMYGQFCYALALKIAKPDKLTQGNMKTYEKEPKID